MAARKRSKPAPRSRTRRAAPARKRAVPARRAKPAARRSKPARRAAPVRSAKPARRASKPARRAKPAPAPRTRKPARKAKAAPAPRKPLRAAAKKTASTRARPAPKRAAKPSRAKPVRKSATKRPSSRSRLRTLPIPPARPKKRSARPPRRRAVPEARPEAEFERTVVDTTFERTEPRTGGALVQDVWAQPEPPAPPPAPPGLPSEAEASKEAADSRRYVAVVSEVPGVEVSIQREREPVAPARAARGKDHYVTDIPVALVSAVLAASTFLPWYKGPPGFGIGATGWASGTWGPVIAFLAAGSLIFVALRRLGVRVGLPVEESLLHEAAGWISLVGAVLMSRLRPGQPGLLTAAYGVWIAIGAAAVLIVLAGRMSPHAPLHVRPGWHKGRAGLLGVVVIGIIVAGSAVFGVTNSPKLQATGGPSNPLAGSVQGKIPDCAKDFPLPAGIKPQYGFGTATSCQAQMTSAKATKVLTDEFRALLKSKGWVFTEDQRQPGVWIFALTKPRCGTLAVVPAESGSIAAVGFQTCGTPSPSPRASRSP